METGRQVQLILDAYRTQLGELPTRVQAQLDGAGEAQATLAGLIESIGTAPLLPMGDLSRFVQRTSSKRTLTLPSVAPEATQAWRAVLESISPAFDGVRSSLQELPPRTREALLVLGAHGWYMDLHMQFPDLWRLQRALGEGETEEAEAFLCDYFRERLKKVEASIVFRFPHRAEIVSAAFAAHKRGEYVLSIPVLLAQADGICREVTDQYLFMTRDKKPRTAQFVERIAAGSFRSALLSPLAQTLPIGTSSWDGSEDSDALNRHHVLHGTSTDYGTETNGLKAVSLVNYIANVVRREPDGPA